MHRLSKAGWIAFAAIGALAAQAGCKSRAFNAQQKSTAGSSAQPSSIVVQCVAPQGNGGNWASTLGWVAEEWMVRAEQTEALDPNAWIYLACAAGGSSGSGVVSTIMALLQNEALFSVQTSDVKARRDQGFFTVRETKTLARAMRYIAMGVDLRFQETGAFASLLLETTVAGKIEEIAQNEILQGIIRTLKEHTKLLTNPWPQCSNRNGAQWWTGQAAEPCDSVVNFAKYAWLARNLTLAQIDAPVSALGQSADTAAEFGMRTVSDALRVASVDEVSANPSKLPAFQGPVYKVLGRVHAAQAQFIDGELEKLIGAETSPRFKGALGASPYGKNLSKVLVRETHGIEAGSDSHPISRDILAAAPRTGFYTITTAFLANKANFDASRKPRYEDLRYFVFGNEETMKAIARSPLLRKQLQEPACAKPAAPGTLDPCFPRRFVLAVVERNLYAIQPSVREPNLMEELVAVAYEGGKVGAQHMGIVKMIDLAGATTSSVPDFQRLTDGSGENLMVGVTGGWPDRRITGWLQGYLIESLVKETWRPKFGDVPMVAFHSTFGKPDSEKGAASSTSLSSSVTPSQRSTASEEDKFDTKAVRSFFSLDAAGTADSGRGQKNVEDYIAMQNEYYSAVGPRALTEAYGFPSFHTEMSVNWDISRVPAFLVRKSRHLVSQSYNSVREGIPTSDTGDAQYCMVVSKSKLGKFACGRFMGASPQVMGKDLFNVNRKIRAQSFITFNAADSRITDTKTKADLESAKD